MIGLMDCNNFFVSCERLFRPDLRKKPVLVLSSNDDCVVARSQEVKDLGVPMGIPYFEVKDLCTKANVTLFSSNFALYRDISARVMTALRSEFPACEVYSIDEAFFEINNDVQEEEIAEIRARIMQKTGIPVSIGIAVTKTLAKVANGIAKKGSGICILDKEHWERVLNQLSCGSVWGIGRQTSAFLSKHKIYTVSDLLTQDRAFIRKELGVVGERLCMELSGVSIYRLGDSMKVEQKSYMSTRSFSKAITDKLTLRSALSYHVAHVAEKLRRDEMLASRITIIMRGSRYGAFAGRVGTVTAILVLPTNDTLILTKEVSRLFETLYDREIPYKKAGVVIGGIEQCDMISGSLFDQNSFKSKARDLSMVTDSLNKRFGNGAIRLGVTLGMEKWKERRRHVSKEYTTKWSEIANVKAI